MATQLAENTRLQGWEGDNLVLSLAPVAERLRNDKTVERLRQALADYYQRPLRLRLEIASAETGGEQTPAERKAALQAERQRQAAQEVADSPLVQALVSAFDAKVIPESIQPLDNQRGET
jgi:DNA polymerase-3 subunit gamma/tau